MGLERELARRSVEQALFGAVMTIGRYVIRGKLGMGGMGTVFLGRDPQLDREVAIKLVRSEQTGATSERLLREAKALAKLAHPNVVAVFEVGSEGDTPFIAMEYVAGRTLGEWCADVEPTVDQIVEMFAAVGRGLAAAHEAEIVHRDFKPSNVVVGADGRPRILDFGIAKAHGTGLGGVFDAEGSVPSRTDPTAQGERDGDLTATSVVMGTPLYMAPEQRDGHEANPRSDQYSFCVALYEALFGVHPFVASTYAQLVVRARNGDIEPPTKPVKVDPALHEAVVKGLVPDPDARHADMSALLEVLERRGRAPARGRALLLTGAVAVAVGIGVWALARRDPCSDAGNDARAAWSQSQRDAVQQGIVGTGRPYAEATWADVDERLGAYSQALGDAEVRACQARHSPPSIIDARALCLDRRRRSLEGLVERLSAIDVDGLEHVAAAVGREASSLDPCFDEELLSLAVPPPEPEVAPEVASVRAAIADARHRRELGGYAEAWKLSTQLVERATAVGYQPLLAEALEEAGNGAHKGGDDQVAKEQLERAYYLASTIAHEEVIARGGVMLVAVTTDLNEVDVAEAWSRHARTDLDRGHAPDALQAYWHDNVGSLHQQRGEYAQALAQHEKALSLLEQPEVDVEAVATVLNNISVALSGEGRFAEALERLERALAMVEAHLPAGHPELADIRNNMGTIHNNMRQRDQAREQFERALEIRVAALGPEHPKTALSHGNLGDTLGQMGLHDEGLEQIDRAIEIMDGNGSSALDVLPFRRQKARLLNTLGRSEEAIPVFEQALKDGREALGPDHPQLLAVAHNLAVAHARAGHHDKAVEHSRQALELGQRVLEPGHVNISYLHHGLGTALYEAGRYAESVEQHRAGLAVREAIEDLPKALLADSNHNIGTTLAKQGDFAGATVHVRRAVEIRRELGSDREARVRLAGSLRELAGFIAKGGDTATAMATFAESCSVLEALDPVDASELGATLTVWAEYELDDGQGAEALAKLERAAALDRSAAHDRGQVARTDFAMARALWVTRGDRTRAVALAERARATFAEEGKHWDGPRAEADDWLAEHGPSRSR